MNRSLEPRKPLVTYVIEYTAGATYSFLAVLFLLWIAGGFQ